MLVLVPAQTSFKELDAYFLADNTGSMMPIIEDVVSEARALATAAFTILDLPSLRIGVGRYQGFISDPLAWENLLSPTTDGVLVQAALDAWHALGGGDGSEAQSYGFHRLAVDPEIGFRPDAKRIVFWFGDAPGHDPVCPTLTGEQQTITEASVTAELQSAGPGGTIVLAASVSSGFYAAALDDDPQESASL